MWIFPIAGCDVFISKYLTVEILFTVLIYTEIDNVWIRQNHVCQIKMTVADTADFYVF